MYGVALDLLDLLGDLPLQMSPTTLASLAYRLREWTTHLAPLRAAPYGLPRIRPFTCRDET